MIRILKDVPTVKTGVWLNDAWTAHFCYSANFELAGDLALWHAAENCSSCSAMLPPFPACSIAGSPDYNNNFKSVNSYQA